MEETSSLVKRSPFKQWMVLTSCVLFHLILGAIVCILPYMSGNLLWWVLGWWVLDAVFISCVSLVAIWVGLSSTVFWQRILRAALVICYVTIVRTVIYLSSLGIPQSEIMSTMRFFFITISVQFIGLTGTLFVMCQFGTRLCLLDKSVRHQYSRFQFSLRSLMGLTLAVAILFSTIASFRMYKWSSLYCAIIGLAAIGIALATIWAGLGQGRPLLRIVPVIVLAIGLGLISAFAIRQEYMIDLAIGIGITSTFAIRQEYIYLSVFSALQVFIIVLPLLVVRSVGYRVVNSNQHKGTENAKPS